MARMFRTTAIGLVLVALVFAVVGLTGAVASGGKGKHHGHHGHHGKPSITSEPFGTANGVFLRIEGAFGSNDGAHLVLRYGHVF